jgi:hypothetical protein
VQHASRHAIDAEQSVLAAQHGSVEHGRFAAGKAKRAK